MKRRLSLLCAVLLASMMLTGCAGRAPANGERFRIVCSTYAPYEFLLQMTASDREVGVYLLADSGEDPHSYQPTAADLAAVCDATVFVCLGAESESWEADAAAMAAAKGVRIVRLTELISHPLTESGEGIFGHAHDRDEQAAYDAHVWLSPVCAQEICSGLCDLLCLVNPAGENDYRLNCSAYRNRLIALDEEYRQMCARAAGNTILVADRFPFLYLTEEYGLSYYAAFPGCSAETEASFATVAALTEVLREGGLGAVLVTESSDGALARTLCESAGRDLPVLTLESIQSTPPTGETYLSLMEKNLEALREALG